MASRFESEMSESEARYKAWREKWARRCDIGYWCAQTCAFGGAFSGLTGGLLHRDWMTWVAGGLTGLALPIAIGWQLIVRHYFRGMDLRTKEIIAEFRRMSGDP